VIIFSVSISFYIQDLLNQKDKKELKNKGLQGVILELKKDQNSYGWSNYYNNRRLNYIDSLFDLSFPFKPEYVSGVWGDNTLIENNKYFDALVSTGAIEFIQNTELQSELSNYYNTEYSLINLTMKSDNRSYIMFSEQIVNYQLDSIKYGSAGVVTKHYFNQSDIKQIRRDKKLKSICLDWTMTIKLENERIAQSKKTIQNLIKLISEELKI
jgi:hypothetical protein|tara:strand:+ start:506 stop:1141 length:636 start_codon:yes stop_codon:yes gene_type:complete